MTTNRANKHWTADVIRGVIEENQAGKSRLTMARDYGRTKGSIHMLLYEWNAYRLQGRKPTSARIERIFQNLSAVPTSNGVTPSAKSSSTVDDDLTTLDAAMRTFSDAVATFIDREVERRSTEKVAQAKAEYEAQIAKLQGIMDAAKESNIAGTIRRKWGLF